MSLYDGLASLCVIAGIVSVNHLCTLRAVANGALPGWRFTIVAIGSIAFVATGIGMLAREPWRYIPLPIAIGLIFAFSIAFLINRGTSKSAFHIGDDLPLFIRRRSNDEDHRS